MLRAGRAGPLAAMLVVMARGSFGAQPLPENVNIRAMARPEGRQLVIQAQLPLAVLRDVKFPLRADTDYVDVPAARPMVRGLGRYWVADRLAVYQNGKLLAKPAIRNARLAAQADPAFQGNGVADAAKLTRSQLTLEVELAYSLAEVGGTVEFQPRVADLGVNVTTELQYMAGNGTIHQFSFTGDPGRFPFEASAADAIQQFFVRGMKSVAAGSDFLLFLFCLTLPLRRYRETVPAAVTFAAGLSLALTAAWLNLAPDGLWFRPLVATLAGGAVLVTALANIAGKPKLRRRALLALGAGMVFGFRLGFDLAARLQFGGTHSTVASIAFTGGAVAATILVLALLVPVLAGLFRFARTERIELIVVSALAADTAWQWVSDRWMVLGRYPVGVPNFDAAFFAAALRWLAILTVLGGLVWFVNGWLAAREQRTDA